MTVSGQIDILTDRDMQTRDIRCVEEIQSDKHTYVSKALQRSPLSPAYRLSVSASPPLLRYCSPLLHCSIDHLLTVCFLTHLCLFILSDMLPEPTEQEIREALATHNDIPQDVVAKLQHWLDKQQH